ncbi:class I SAM-dependent methyltransferase [Verrucomicrobiota bacterium]
MRLKQIKTAFRVLRGGGLAGVARVLLIKLATPTRVSPSPVGRIWTEYMSWLTMANAGMLCRGNMHCFDYAMRNLPSASPIVEIGSFCGLSTNMITYLKERNNVRNPLVTCDKWILENAEQGGMLGDSRTVSHAAYGDFLRDTYIRNVRMFSRADLPYTIEVFSDEFFSAWGNRERRQDVFGREFSLGGPISFCYIDGNHSYDFAKRDFENADKYLEEGGFLLFDDSGDGTQWEVCRVVREVLRTDRYELVAKNPNYFFRKRSNLQQGVSGQDRDRAK